MVGGGYDYRDLILLRPVMAKDRREKRVIKFRGKSIGNDHWIYGGFHVHDKVRLCIASDEQHKNNRKTLIVIDGMADWNLSVPINCIEVYPESLGQFTGLKDKNGKEIYEGDIIIIDQYTIVKVVWGTDCWELIMEDNEPYIDDSLGNFNDLIEVIGNIYENPELCKS